MVRTVISRLCGFLRWSRFQITRLQGYAGLQGCNFAGTSTHKETASSGYFQQV